MNNAAFTNEPADEHAVMADVERALERVALVREAVGKVIIGQQEVIDQALITLLSGGHALLVGVPGLAKTKLVETLAVVLGLPQQRIQFTPDLMPADILGTEVMDESIDGRRSLRFVKGPIFAEMVMADEINRASPRTQSALLQAMQEYQVTIAGQSYDVPRPFHVLATQNPLEQEGTYPLPEAQLDRFLMQISVDYPDREAEKRIVMATTGSHVAQAAAVLDAHELIKLQALVRRMPIGASVVDAIVDLVRSARPDVNAADSGGDHEIARLLAWGPGPRAAQALMLASRARALLDRRLAPSVDDVVALAQPILQHRMALHFGARAQGETISKLIKRLCDRVG